MSDCYLGEIRMVSFPYPPRGWAFCNGQILPIAQNQALFSLLGVSFGGNGVTSFQLPDLRGRMPLHPGTSPSGSFVSGQRGGEEATTLTQGQMPMHIHQMGATTALGSAVSPTGALPAKKGRLGRDMFAPLGNLTTLHPASVATAGASQPHPNMQPFTTLNFAIALSGIYPSRS